MKKISNVISLMIILILSFGVNLGQAQQTGETFFPTNTTRNEGNYPWQSEYIDQASYPDDVGTYASLALKPFSDIPYVSFYNAKYGDLMLAHHAPGSGNCDSYNDDWDCEVVDPGDDNADVGTYTSLDFWADEANQLWKIGISYHDATHRALKFTGWTCGRTYCTIHNTDTIDLENSPYNAGIGTSLAFSPDGAPHIAYYLSNATGDDFLMLANYVGSGGNCGVGSAFGQWKCRFIDSGPAVGQYPSLDFSYPDLPTMAYYDGNMGWLKAAYPKSGGNCGNNNDWQCDTIDNGAPDNADVGKYASIKTSLEYIAPGRFAYYDQTNGHLKYRYSIFQEGDPMVVDDMGWSDTTMGISMAIDDKDWPVIVYQKMMWNSKRLYIARPYYAYNDGQYGNCGDNVPYYDYRYWRCYPLDNAGQYLSEADYVALAINSNNLAQVAYSEFYNNNASDYATSLKYIFQRFPIFLPLLQKP
jgi:hypothetical protein